MPCKASLRIFLPATFLVVLAIALCLCVAGCSSSSTTSSSAKAATLEELLKSGDQQMLNLLKAEANDASTDKISVKFSVSGNTITYTKTFTNISLNSLSESTRDRAKKDAVSNLESQDASRRTEVKEYEEIFGISGIVIKEIQYDGDHTLIASRTYSA